MSKKGKVDCLENFVDQDAPWIILFHGYGADANDLQSLSSLQTKKTYNWLFPNGVHSVNIGMGWTGRAWWNIDMESYQKAVQTGEDRNLTEVVPTELPNTRAAVMDMIESMKIPWNKIILGGFSQGAMLATDIFLRAKETPKGLVILSGSLICKPEWKEIAKARAGAKFFQSHGEMDPVLSMKGASRLNQFLLENGLKGKLNSFRGGHEIPANTLQLMAEYIDSISEINSSIS